MYCKGYKKNEIVINFCIYKKKYRNWFGKYEI